MHNVTAEGQRRITEWLRSVDEYRRKQEAMFDAARDEKAAEEALINWLAPSDAKPGEKIAIWFGDSLIQLEMGYDVPLPEGATIGEHKPTRVTVRSRGEELKHP